MTVTQEELRRSNRRGLIEPLIYYDEFWKKIELFNLKPIYWVSTYGRVYNEETGYVMSGHIVDNGYVVVSCKTVDNIRLYLHVHRLVMMVFNPNPDYAILVVNHIDGNKTNNCIWNLEWVTQKENVAHAFRIGLRKTGEFSSHSIFTNDQIHKVCKCMEDGMNIYQLSNSVFGKYPDQQIKTLCTNIYSRKFWKEISSNYNISNYKRNMIFSEPQIHLICKYISENNSIDTTSILHNLGIFDYTKEEYEVFNRAIWNIKRGKNFKYISSKYNI